MIASQPEDIFVEDLPKGLQWPAQRLVDCASSLDWPSVQDAGAPELWRHPLDEPSLEDNGDATELLLDPSAEPPIGCSSIPPSLDAPQHIDYLAYWQAYLAVELEDAARRDRLYLPGTQAWTGGQHERLLKEAASSNKRIQDKWKKRETTFEWIACYRTLLAKHHLRSLVDGNPGFKPLDESRQLAVEYGLTPDGIAGEIRDVLLVMWRESDRIRSFNKQAYRALLREDIQRALSLRSAITGYEFDLNDPAWTYPGRGQQPWSELIEALPLEVGLVRRHLARRLALYVALVPPEGDRTVPATEPEIEPLLKRHWVSEPSLRRVGFALHRLQRELKAPDKHAVLNTIPSHERIEQMLLCTLHTEKVLSSYNSRFSGATKAPEVRKTVKRVLDAALCKFTRLTSKQRARTVRTADKLMGERGQLHTGVPEARDLFLAAESVCTGSRAGDLLTTAHINFVIARNYMAHHDLRDEELAFGGGDKKAPGFVLLTSALTTLVTCLALQAKSAKK